MKVSSVQEMREMDRSAIETFGIVEEILMENAGLAAFQVLSDQVGIGGKCFVVVCGAGNNGGDGLVMARKIHSAGGEARVFILSDPDRYRGAAKTNFDIISRLPIPVQVIQSPGELAEDVRRCDAVVDAIFGTGLARNVEGRFHDVIELINQSRKPVLSLDIPSGVNGDTGQVMGIAVKAHHTVTFGLPKIGNMLYPGYDLCGSLYVTHISFPPCLYESDKLTVEINHPPVIPLREPDGHKGWFGDVLFIAGAAGYLGAPYFSAMAFLKAGGGYSRLAAPQSITPFIAAKGSEMVFHPQKETPGGSIALENKAGLLDLAQKTDMVVMGPGLSLDKETQQLVRELSDQISAPLLLDGDGITALCAAPDIIRRRKAPTILTPHAGEMSRLTGIDVSEIAGDRVNILKETCKDLNAVIVLKGAHSLIAYPDGRVFINMTGNSGMATAGSGDVLTGAVAAMFGLGMTIPDSVRTGVFLHGLSGDIARDEKGPDGITAGDILECLPQAVKRVRQGDVDSGIRGI
jgi:NAD(P)H-hydrate epimerase